MRLKPVINALAHQCTMFCFCLFFTILAVPGLTMGDDTPTEPADEPTMLMFVGEQLDVLTIASRREESAWQAPAVARVITRDQLRNRGAATLGEALEKMPGFFMSRKEWGMQPYLRGIPNSVLFLYDTVPISSDIKKSWNLLDHEMSLAPVKRIEIVRGPGSVLWGPDAFAGIVNVVPMTGKDLNGTELGITYDYPGDQKGFFANHGYHSGNYDLFLSLSGRRGEEDDRAANIKRFWGNGQTPVSPEQRYGETQPDDSRYLEAFGSLSIGDWLHLSSRISDSRKPYRMSDASGRMSWLEARSVPTSFVKLEAKKDVDISSTIRFTGTFSSLHPEYDLIDRTISQRETTSYGELIYDRSFFAGSGLMTGGISFREKHVKNAPVWNSYFPDFLGDENRFFLPLLSQEDYNTRLWSLFLQFNQKMGHIDVWGGIRKDFHDKYKDHISYNAGVSWEISTNLMMKILFGTAYRTPFSRQLISDEEPDLEKIKSISSQIVWKFNEHLDVALCGFASRIDNHIMEDPYAGLSVPNHQSINGIELEMNLSPSKKIQLSAKLTALDNTGPQETYRYNDYSYIRADGTIVEHFVDLAYPYDIGSDIMFNLMGTMNLNRYITTYAGLSYFSDRKLIYPRGDTFIDLPGVWLLDATATVRDILPKGLELELALKNCTDRKYEIPGTYSTLSGDPFSVHITLRKKW